MRNVITPPSVELRITNGIMHNGGKRDKKANDFGIGWLNCRQNICCSKRREMKRNLLPIILKFCVRNADSSISQFISSHSNYIFIVKKYYDYVSHTQFPSLGAATYRSSAFVNPVWHIYLHYPHYRFGKRHRHSSVLCGVAALRRASEFLYSSILFEAHDVEPMTRRRICVAGPIAVAAAATLPTSLAFFPRSLLFCTNYI